MTSGQRGTRAGASRELHEIASSHWLVSGRPLRRNVYRFPDGCENACARTRAVARAAGTCLLRVCAPASGARCQSDDIQLMVSSGCPLERQLSTYCSPIQRALSRDSSLGKRCGSPSGRNTRTAAHRELWEIARLRCVSSGRPLATRVRRSS